MTTVELYNKIKTTSDGILMAHSGDIELTVDKAVQAGVAIGIQLACEQITQDFNTSLEKLRLEVTKL